MKKNLKKKKKQPKLQQQQQIAKNKVSNRGRKGKHCQYSEAKELAALRVARAQEARRCGGEMRDGGGGTRGGSTFPPPWTPKRDAPNVWRAIVAVRVYIHQG